MSGWLQRRGMPVLVIGLACAILAFVVAGFLPDRYTAEAVVVVPSGAKGGLAPGEASNLATTYANLIPEDRAILARTSAQLGLPSATVRKNLLVTHDFDTSILRLFFSDSDPAIATRGSRLVAESIAGPKPVSPRIAPDSVSIVARPREAKTQSFDPIQAILLGLFLGLVGGGLLMLAWDRADSRIRDAKGLGLEAGCAASSLRETSDESLVALLDRWVDIASTRPLRVALLAATPTAETGCQRAAERLMMVARRQSKVVRMTDPGILADLDVMLEVGGAIGGPAAGERLTRTANLIALVVAEETPVDDVRHALDVLVQFGARPDWALLVDRPNTAIERVVTFRTRETGRSQAASSQQRWTPVGATRTDPPAAQSAGQGPIGTSQD